MPRQVTLTLLLTLFCVTSLLGQQKKRRRIVSSWKDTTFIPIKLNGLAPDSKVIVFEIGKKATIFLSLAPVLADARDRLSNEEAKGNYHMIVDYLTAASLKSDTIFPGSWLQLQRFEYLIALQLADGNAKIFYKKQQVFVDSISHRLERSGGNATRFFYLPDRRPFFSILQLIGIIDSDDEDWGMGHLQDYIKEGEKLRSISEE